MSAKKIFLIDDEQSVLQALKLLLNAIGHEVREFSNPLTAIEFFDTTDLSEFDIMLCDLRMPDKSGFEVLSEVRARSAALPFVMISGHATEQEKDKAYSLGANAFLNKPFTPDQIQEILSANFSKERARGA